jgi:hypothetical protein
MAPHLISELYISFVLSLKISTLQSISQSINSIRRCDCEEKLSERVLWTLPTLTQLPWLACVKTFFKSSAVRGSQQEGFYCLRKEAGRC